MPRNGAGSFVLVPGNPVVTNTTISSAWANNTMSDLASGLTQSIAKDGQTVPTANLPMGGFKHTGAADATATGQYLTYGQDGTVLGNTTIDGTLTMSGLLQLDQSTNIVAAATTDLGTATGNSVTVTHASGTLAITSFGGASLQSGTELTITWSVSGGSLSATYNATSLILPSAANLTIADGDVWKIQKISDSLAYWRVVDVTKADGTPVVVNATQILPITASVGSNALTITLNPTTLDFRDATLGSGTVNTRKVPSAISVVVSSGSTLGTINAIQNRLAVLAIDNAGTVELAVVNLAGGVNLDETGVISTTAEGGAGGADSSTVIYSTTARTNVPYRVVGFVESTQATAGTWAAAPSLIQGAGGESLKNTSKFLYGTAITLSGSTANFTGIPSWVNRVTGIISSMSTSGSGVPAIQIGDSGGLETTGYLGSTSWTRNGSSPASGLVTNGLGLNINTGAAVSHGIFVIQRLSGNTWSMSWVGAESGAAITLAGACSKTLSGGLDRLTFITSGTFGGGTVNICWE